MNQTTDTTDFQFDWEGTPKLTDYGIELAIKNPKSLPAWVLRAGFKELKRLRGGGPVCKTCQGTGYTVTERDEQGFPVADEACEDCRETDEDALLLIERLRRAASGAYRPIDGPEICSIRRSFLGEVADTLEGLAKP